MQITRKQTKPKYVTVALTDDRHRQIDRLARRHKTSKADVVRQMVEHALDAAQEAS